MITYGISNSGPTLSLAPRFFAITMLASIRSKLPWEYLKMDVYSGVEFEYLEV